MLPREIAKIRLDFLQSFQELIRVKNFSKTADNLGITQGTVSQHLKELEKVFGDINFINRSSKIFEITQEGELLYEATNKIVGIVDKLREQLNHLNDNKKILIKIISSSIPGTYILPRLIMDIQPKFPNYEFDIDVINSSKAINKLLNREVSFCAVGSLFEMDEKQFDLKFIGSDNITILTRVGHPIIQWVENKKNKFVLNELQNQLIKYPWVFREKGSATRDWFLKKWPNSKKINIALDFHDNLAIINAIKKSDAITALSSKIVEGMIRNRDITIIDYDIVPKISRNFYLVKLKNGNLTDAEKEIWDCIPENQFRKID